MAVAEAEVMLFSAASGGCVCALMVGARSGHVCRLQLVRAGHGLVL